MTTQQTSVRAAVVQAGALPFDTEACVDKAVRLIAEASALGAKVIVFPEAFIPGYLKGVIPATRKFAATWDLRCSTPG